MFKNEKKTKKFDKLFFVKLFFPKMHRNYDYFLIKKTLLNFIKLEKKKNTFF